jgi:hypothetical protein
MLRMALRPNPLKKAVFLGGFVIVKRDYPRDHSPSGGSYSRDGHVATSGEGVDRSRHDEAKRASATVD